MFKRRRRRRRRRKSAAAINNYVGNILTDVNNKNNMISDVLKQKKDILIKKGWEECRPEFDLNYFNEVSSKNLNKSLGYFISTVSKELSDNWFSIFGEQIDTAKDNFLNAMCPPSYIPEAPPSTAFIQASWPFNLNDYNSTTEAAFEELTYRVIIRIIKLLGIPNSVHQSLGNSREIVLKLKPEKFNLDDILILDNLIVVWDDVYLKVEHSQSWNDNGAVTSFQWYLHSNNIREYSSQVLHNIGVELNPSSYQLGDLDPDYKLDSFPDYIKDYTLELKKDMGVINKKYPERFNALITGPPGYGKTKWSQAIAAEILAPLGYLILVIDYSTLQDLVIPSYIGKVCIIINDADTLALDRENSVRGETEQVLAWLDGARISYIKPFHLEKRTSVINIMTANSILKWDNAALRKGRIHKHIIFDKIKLCET